LFAQILVTQSKKLFRATVKPFDLYALDKLI
jgi:hypothetical protein